MEKKMENEMETEMETRGKKGFKQLKLLKV